MTVTLWIYRDFFERLCMHYGPHCPVAWDAEGSEKRIIGIHQPAYGGGYLGDEKWDHPWPEHINNLKPGEMAELHINLVAKWKIPESKDHAVPEIPATPITVSQNQVHFWRVGIMDEYVTQTDTTVALTESEQTEAS